jgi:hypothetical protein
MEGNADGAIALNMCAHSNMCMSNITLYVPENVKKEMDSHDEVRWSEVARKAIMEKIIQMKKLDLLRKYVEKEPFTDEDYAWMDENDWHPVDEKEMKLSFIKKLEKRSKEKSIHVKNIRELWE